MILLQHAFPIDPSPGIHGTSLQRVNKRILINFPFFPTFPPILINYFYLETLFHFSWSSLTSFCLKYPEKWHLCTLDYNNIVFKVYLYPQFFVVDMLTLKRPGGGLNQPPPRHFPRPFRRANFFYRAARWLFTFKSRASYDTIFVKIGHTVTTLQDLLYKLVRPKMAQKRDFVYKVNANGVFSPYS